MGKKRIEVSTFYPSMRIKRQVVRQISYRNISRSLWDDYSWNLPFIYTDVEFFLQKSIKPKHVSLPIVNIPNIGHITSYPSLLCNASYTISLRVRQVIVRTSEVRPHTKSSIRPTNTRKAILIGTSFAKAEYINHLNNKNYVTLQE